MTTLLWCLVIITFLPLLRAVVGDVIRLQQETGFDNHNPRVQINTLQGLGSRVYAAHQNAWEALTMFAPCVFIAHTRSAESNIAGIIGIVFVVVRVLHGIAYCLDLATLRSLIWFVGVGCLGYLVHLAV